MLLVKKFGGSSLKTLKHISHAADIVKSSLGSKHKVLVVVSAMGGVTDDLHNWARQVSPDPDPREVDMLLTSGERISMSLFSLALGARGVQSKSFTGSQCGILTDETHGNARIKEIKSQRLSQAFSTCRVVIVAGFQGVSPITKDVTTLGRGGSDLTAVALAIQLKAQRCEIYSDVRGVYTGNPRVCNTASLLPAVSWETMSELAWSGAQVLHHRGVFMAQKYSLPLYLYSTEQNNLPGTIITKCGESEHMMEQPLLSAVTQKDNLTWVVWTYDHVEDKNKSLPQILKWLWDYEESPLISRQQSCTNEADKKTHTISVLISRKLAPLLIEHLGKTNVKNKDKKLSVISIVGSGLRHNPDVVRELINTPSIPNSEYLEISDMCIRLVWESTVAQKAYQILHDNLLHQRKILNSKHYNKECSKTIPHLEESIIPKQIESEINQR